MKKTPMQRRIAYLCCLFILGMSPLLPVALPAYASSSRISNSPHTLADFPTVDPNYIYDQLFYMVTNFQHREAGYDNNLPVNVNGHDEFANYWSQQMLRNFMGFGPQVRIDKFPVQGWQSRPATVPAFNVEVSVPGVMHPEQVVVIGCHYDGEAISTQSANDDGSGCAIELGVAKAMADYWRSHHTYPARTLRFVIFDAEEQGLFGSFHYVNDTVNGDLSNIVAMFNEEQNGIAYPLRYLGKTANPLLPFYVYMSPLQSSRLYPDQDKLSQQQKANITRFRTLMQQAVLAIFAQFQALGFQSITYYDDNNQHISQPVFSSDQINNVHLEDDRLGGSDQIPFTLAGVPCATFIGNTTYYDANPPPWSYPFDQKEDTIQLMNTFASGSSRKAQALVLALAIPGMLTSWMLNQDDILGQAPATSQPIAAISDIGQTVVHQNIGLDGSAAFDPGNDSNTDLHYTWDFGDGRSANGVSVNHTYQAVGNYFLSLTVTSSKGSLRILKAMHIVTRAMSFGNPYGQGQADGVPPSNPAVALPTPNDDQISQVLPTSPQRTPTSGNTAGGSLILIGAVVGSAIVILLAGVVFVQVKRRKREV